MRILLDKSYENIEAAKVLITKPNECNVASIHCSYYSCFQLVVHVLKNHYGNTDTRQLRDIGNFEGSHEHTANLLFNKLREFDRSQQPKDRIATHFNRYMNFLRNMRNKADYKEVVIEPFSGKYVYDDAVKLRKILIDTYKLTPTK